MKKSFFNPKTYTVPAGAEITYSVHGNFWFVAASTAAIGITFDDNTEFGSFTTGLVYELEPGEHFEKLRLKNTSGSPITVTIIAGNGKFSDWRKEFTLDSATITALAAAINATVTLKVGVSDHVEAGGAVGFSNCKSFYLRTVGGDCRIQSTSGTDYMLGDGKDYKASCETDANILETITITPQAGATATVSRVYV